MAWQAMMDLRGTAKTPLRGPAQPLAAGRSGACQAVLGKQSALTLRASASAVLALDAPATPSWLAFDRFPLPMATAGFW